jgi:hypothetical protein
MALYLCPLINSAAPKKSERQKFLRSSPASQMAWLESRGSPSRIRTISAVHVSTDPTVGNTKEILLGPSWMRVSPHSQIPMTHAVRYPTHCHSPSSSSSSSTLAPRFRRRPAPPSTWRWPAKGEAFPAAAYDRSSSPTSCSRGNPSIGPTGRRWGRRRPALRRHLQGLRLPRR